MPKDMSQDKAKLNSEKKIKPVALAIIKLHSPEGDHQAGRQVGRQAGRQLVENSIE